MFSWCIQLLKNEIIYIKLLNLKIILNDKSWFSHHLKCYSSLRYLCLTRFVISLQVLLISNMLTLAYSTLQPSPLKSPHTQIPFPILLFYSFHRPYHLSTTRELITLSIDLCPHSSTLNYILHEVSNLGLFCSMMYLKCLASSRGSVNNLLNEWMNEWMTHQE